MVGYALTWENMGIGLSVSRGRYSRYTDFFFFSFDCSSFCKGVMVFFRRRYQLTHGTVLGSIGCILRRLEIESGH